MLLSQSYVVIVLDRCSIGNKIFRRDPSLKSYKVSQKTKNGTILLNMVFVEIMTCFIYFVVKVRYPCFVVSRHQEVSQPLYTLLRWQPGQNKDPPCRTCIHETLLLKCSTPTPSSTLNTLANDVFPVQTHPSSSEVRDSRTDSLFGEYTSQSETLRSVPPN